MRLSLEDFYLRRQRGPQSLLDAAYRGCRAKILGSTLYVPLSRSASRRLIRRHWQWGFVADYLSREDSG